jgi:hypothetical protein
VAVERALNRSHTGDEIFEMLTQARRRGYECEKCDPEGFFLFRLKADGKVCGDTWHRSLEEAMKQVEFEFGPVSEWKDVPSSVVDVAGFILEGT